MDNTEEFTAIELCAGYAGIHLGLKRVIPNLRTVAYSEIELFAIKNLVAKMEKGYLEPAPIHPNLRTFPGEEFRNRVHLVTGGYPCQPFSSAGQRRGSDDPRHLWPHISRIVSTVRPLYCFFENVEGHVTLGLSTVISDLEEMGYRTTWGLFSSSERGFIHQRKRIFIFAESSHLGCGGREDSYGISKWIQELPRVKQKVVWCQTERRIRNEPSPGFSCKPLLDRRTDGIANRLDRLRLLGNGVVPATVEKAWRTLYARLLTG